MPRDTGNKFVELCLLVLKMTDEEDHRRNRKYFARNPTFLGASWTPDSMLNSL